MGKALVLMGKFLKKIVKMGGMRGVNDGKVQETDIYKYLGMVINKLGNLKDHILELNRKCEVINREINAVREKQQVGKEEIRVKLKLYETCLMPALLYRLEA